MHAKGTSCMNVFFCGSSFHLHTRVSVHHDSRERQLVPTAKRDHLSSLQYVICNVYDLCERWYRESITVACTQIFEHQMGQWKVFHATTVDSSPSSRCHSTCTYFDTWWSNDLHTVDARKSIIIVTIPHTDAWLLRSFPPLWFNITDTQCSLSGASVSCISQTIQSLSRAYTTHPLRHTDRGVQTFLVGEKVEALYNDKKWCSPGPFRFRVVCCQDMDR